MAEQDEFSTRPQAELLGPKKFSRDKAETFAKDCSWHGSRDLQQPYKCLDLISTRESARLVQA